MRLPLCTGNYTVGCIDLMTKPTELSKKTDPYSLCNTDLGSLMRVYYPCVATSTKCTKTKWIPEPNQYLYSYGMARHAKMGSFSSWLVHSFTKNIRIDAHDNAGLIDHAQWREKQRLPAIKDNLKLPLVIFSHGLSASRGLYSIFCAQLASEGFVVANVEHRDGSACSSFTIDENNETHEIPYHLLHTNDDGDEEMHKLRQTQLAKRTKEISAALDVLEGLDSQPEAIENLLSKSFDLTIFKNRINTESVLMMGHSFGGATALSSLKNDPRLKCGIGLDVWFVPLPDSFYKENKATEKPVLLINTELFNWNKNLRRCNTYINNTSKDLIEMITLKGTEHYDQSDIPGVIPKLVQSWFHTKKIPHRLPFDVATAEQRKVIIDYFSKYLLNEGEAVNFLSGYTLPEVFMVGSNIVLDETENDSHVIHSDVDQNKIVKSC